MKHILKHIFGLAVLLAAFTATTYASTCNIGALYNTNAPTCTETLINVDGSGGSETLTFTSLVDTGTDAASIFANLDGNAAIGLGGFTFTDTNGSFSQVGTTGLGYTASITSCAAGFTCAITGYVDQILIPSGSAADVVSLTGLANEDLNLANQTDDALNTVNLQTATKLGTYNGLATQISYESDVVTTVAAIPTPEPSGLLMLSSGLIGLGFMKRKVFLS